MASSCLSLIVYQKEEMKESSEATDQMMRVLMLVTITLSN